MKQHRNITARQEALSERSLFATVLTLKTVDECRAFFRDLCTPAELQAISDRWAVVEWLQKGLPYREIHRLTEVSVTTIGRVSRCLADGNGGYSLAVTGQQRPPDACGAGQGLRCSTANTSTIHHETHRQRPAPQARRAEVGSPHRPFARSAQELWPQAIPRP
jgi:TrpR-related protein YerC/YecD